jgi:hypothetical protein
LNISETACNRITTMATAIACKGILVIDKKAAISQSSVTWNHGLIEVLNSLIRNGLEINSLDEVDYSPYNCFNNTIEFELKKYRIEQFGNKLPMVYSITATKKTTE